VGDTVWVLLARATSEQVEIEMRLVGLFERLPGFPDGADALLNIATHETMVASTAPAFFLAQARDGSDATLERATATLRNQHGSTGALQIDTRLTALAKDQSSLAALNISGLLKLDSAYSLAMGTVTIAIFVFGLLLQRRREYVTLRAQGMEPRAIRTLIGAEASTAALAGCCVGVVVGLMMAYYFINVLRPLFILDPPYSVPQGSLRTILGSVLAATVMTSVAASSLVNRLRASELLRDE
jgi:ABC-type antimicrobial peptide transport system permease subunit